MLDAASAVPSFLNILLYQNTNIIRWMCHISYNLPYMLKVMDPLQLMQKTEIVFDDIIIFKSFLKTLKLAGFVFFVYRTFVCKYEILCCHFFYIEFKTIRHLAILGCIY
jgi:hypothetical protein